MLSPHWQRGKWKWKDAAGKEQIRNTRSGKELGYMLLLKNTQGFVFCILELRSWVRALEAKLPQEKIIRTDATLASQ